MIDRGLPGTVVARVQFLQRLEAEIVGDHFSRFYTLEDRQARIPETALRTAVTTGRFEAEGWRVRKDGERFWAHVVIDTIRNGSGQLIGFAKITRDLSERKLAQAAAGENVSDLIDNAIQGAQRGAWLTQCLLAFSQKQELKLEAVDVPKLVTGMSNLLQRPIGPSVEINTSFPLSLPLAKSDPNQLEGALLNLVVNARDAMPEGGLITISARRRSLSARQVPHLPAADYVCLFARTKARGWTRKPLRKPRSHFLPQRASAKERALVFR